MHQMTTAVEELPMIADWVREARANRRGRPNGGLFIPLEVVNREYPGKLLLTAEMLSRGMPVFLGHKSEVIDLALKSSEAGILLYKSAWGTGCDFFKPLLEKGFAICAQDEEAGIIYEHFADFFNKRISVRTSGYLDRFFCWGSDDYNHIRLNALGDPNAIQLAGSPRTVTWGPLGGVFHRNEIDRIRNKHGDFVLFATNFGSGNSYLGEDRVKHLQKFPGWETRKKIFRIQVERDRRLMRLFSEAAAVIGQKLGRNVVIRPHPAEDIAQWERVVRGLTNVTIAADGPVTPWMLAADCLIHNSCTTGFEAAVANVPTIALGETTADFLVASEQLPDMSIPNQCSMQIEGIKPLLEVLGNVNRAWEMSRDAHENVIARKLHKPGTLDPVKIIADSLLEISGEPNAQANWAIGRDSILYDIRELYRTSRFRRSSLGSKMDQGKRPTMRMKQVCEDMARALDVIGSRAEFAVRRVAQNAFRLHKVA
jgi:surface carbohydrate biosynthesis protein